MLNDESSPGLVEAQANVREMAKKFERLMQIGDQTTQHENNPPKVPTATKSASGSSEAKRLAAYQRRRKKPVRPTPNIISVKTTTTTITTTTIEQAHQRQPPATTEATEHGDRTEYDEVYNGDCEHDDLLFDKLITDINTRIVINESTLRYPYDNTAYEYDDGPLYETIGEEEPIYDEICIYQNPQDVFQLPENGEPTKNLPVGRRVIEELLDKEKSYIQALSTGIDNYIMAPDADDLPSKATQEHLYGNIIVIRNFHQNTLLPGLEKCGMDAERICAIFCQLIEEGYFYSYIEYAVNRKRAKDLFDQNQTYFQRRAAEVEDRLGVESSFLIQPIQRLPRYQLLLYQLIKDLGERLTSDNAIDIKSGIAACCRAEKHIQRLLDRMNDAMTIGDIVEFHTNLDFLLLNIANHGEFQMVDAFDIHDHERRKRYKGKLFLFDKCVVFTESETAQRLRFRGFYQQNHVGIAFAQDRCRFYLYHMRRGNQEIECETDAGSTVFKRWSDALSNMMLSSAGTIMWNVAEPKRSMSH